MLGPAGLSAGCGQSIMKHDQNDRGGLPLAWQAFNHLRSCRTEIGISRGALQSLSAMISFLREGQGTVVHASNRTLAERAACCDRSLRRHIAELERLGILRRISSPNRKRFRLFNPDGEDLAFGMDLAPMMNRAEEFAAQSEARALLQARLRLMTQRIRASLARRAHRAVAGCNACASDAPAPTPVPECDPVLSTHRVSASNDAPNGAAADALDIEARRLLRGTCDLDTLAALAERLEGLEAPAPLQDVDTACHADALSIAASRSPEMSASSGQTVRHIQDHQKEDPLKMTAEKLLSSGAGRGARAAQAHQRRPYEPAAPAGRDARPIGLDEIRRLCPDALSHALAPIRTMSDVLHLAWTLAPQVGIAEPLLRQACAAQGPEIPLLTVLGIVQKIRAIRCPGAYFRALFFGRRAASFHLSRLLAGSPAR